MNFARYATIHARHLPDKTCLIERTPSVNKRKTLTWKQFNDRINKTANYLSKELGIKEGDFVLHLQLNSIEWLVTYFAIIKIGAVVVPLNFRFVESDLRHVAGVCDPKAFILGAEFLPVVQPVQKEFLSIEHYICVGQDVPGDMISYEKLAAYGDTSEALVDLDDLHDLAMMFTSGTTGKPKPVIHTHYSLNNTAIANGMSRHVHRNDNYVFFLPLYHSGAMFYWASFYATGATGTILKEFKEPRWIIETMAEEKGTDVFLVVPNAVALLNDIKSGKIDLADYDLSSWRYFEIGAQPVPFDVIKQLVQTLPCIVSNTYGITEGGGGATIDLLPEDILRKPGSIGKPNFGVDAKVVDIEGKEVGPGGVGELIINTNRMMKGYFNNQELTSDVLKDGWLYTGDLARTDEEGFFYVVDRKKDMITCGGENIFPVEIEDAIMDHPKIDDVACIGYPDDRLVEIVLAIIQLKEGEPMTEEEFMTFARSKLPLYKVPRKVIFDKVMRNPTGKLMKPEMRKKYTGRKEAFASLT
ncbi:MAG TPA: long-chain fatty acid--CoA ligase [Desulfobacteraceae bacterium]|nr:long-chain fatty acid--CoA ligase [Desulfobacteraceae bacterium]